MAKSKKLDLGSLPAKVEQYKGLLNNTIEYRKKWPKVLKPMIIKSLEQIKDETGLGGTVEIKDQVQNLESVVYNLGRSSSGLYENIEDSDIKRNMIKSNGALIYQQLFNGKVINTADGYTSPTPRHADSRCMQPPPPPTAATTPALCPCSPVPRTT